MNKRRIAIIGSTGSVGRQAMEIIAASDELAVCALAAGSNWRLLAEQARQFRPAAVAVADPAAKADLAKAVGRGVKVLAGPDAMAEVIHLTRPDLTLTALVGAAGLAPTLAAIECKSTLAVANKESLVMAGALVMPLARRAGVTVLPVDSEHSAIFQCLLGRRHEDIRRITLTASGGPFRTWPARRIRAARLEDVLNHPTWRMGRKITIDSATLVNKALEVIEARWLFDVSAEQIQVVIHPQSLVHGYVEFADGSVLAQLGTPSMLTPIGFALHYPRQAPQLAKGLDLAAAGRLDFAPADFAKYPALALGYEVIRRGGTAGVILNAANEAAVEAFVAGRIPFVRIVDIVEKVLARTDAAGEVTPESIQASDAEARGRAREIIARTARPRRTSKKVSRRSRGGQASPAGPDRRNEE